MQATLEKTSNYILLQVNSGVHTIRFTSFSQYQFNLRCTSCMHFQGQTVLLGKYLKQPTKLLVSCPGPIWNGVSGRD